MHETHTSLHCGRYTLQQIRKSMYQKNIVPCAAQAFGQKVGLQQIIIDDSSMSTRSRVTSVEVSPGHLHGNFESTTCVYCGC